MGKAKRIVVKVGVVLAVVLGATVAYASVFGEENITLWKQLSELVGINNNTYQSLKETREGLDYTREMVDDARRARALVRELNDYSTDKFIDDFKRDFLNTYPDIDYIINNYGAEGLDKWRDSEMESPMSSYELIGAVFGEVTDEVKNAQKDGLVELEGPVLYRYEAATSLAVADDANDFIERADEDIDMLVEQLNGASKEQAIVLQAKIQALSAAQNSHMLRMMARMLRREGVEDARRYQSAIKAMEYGLEFDKGLDETEVLLRRKPSMIQFDNSYDWLE